MKTALRQHLTPGAKTLVLWGLIAVLGVLSFREMAVQGIALAPGTLPGLGLPVIAILILSFVYRAFRPDARIATLAHLSAATLAFTLFAAILSYLVVAWNRPEIDAALDAADKALGLDWLTPWHWIEAHQYVDIALLLAYASNIPQMIFLLVVLNYLGRMERAWELQWLFMATALLSILGSGLWPAQGPFGYYGVRPDAPYLPVYMDLRHGDLRMISHDSVQGIITFPSLHTAQALIYAYAARGIRILFPLLLVLNIGVIVSTPFIGGHYYVDLLGGAVIAFAAIGLVSLISRYRNRGK